MGELSSFDDFAGTAGEPLIGASQRRVLNTALSLSIHERQLITVPAFTVMNEGFYDAVDVALAPLTKAKNLP